MRRLIIPFLTLTLAACSQSGTGTSQDDATQEIRSDAADTGSDAPFDALSPDSLADVPDTMVSEVMEILDALDVMDDELAQPFCGDSSCSDNESCETCPQDCGQCPPQCGNANCEEGESCGSCPQDCGQCPPECGNGTCEGGEGCVLCPQDCGQCPSGCGDAQCDPDTENCQICPEDCGACPGLCGDGNCTVGETCKLCPQDCGVCPPECGDGSVNQPSEQCDDGNLIPEDGCSPECKWEVVIGPGVIIITELMKNPDKVDDIVGEWIELYNTTAMPIDINGWVIKDGGTDYHVIMKEQPFVIGGKKHIVLARNGQPSINGGLTVDYVYDNINLSNKDDEILLLSPDLMEIDRVLYDDGISFPDPIGKSLALNPERYDIESNDFGESWCEGTTAYGLGDMGSPGAPNPACPVPEGCPNGICEADENCLSCAEDCGQCPMVCGDGLCVAGEGCQTCPTDCGECPVWCGDLICNNNETCQTCPQDCGYCCGNGLCDYQENCQLCPDDCGLCCGDGTCSQAHNETCANCPDDCGSCSACGNGFCDIGEECGDCPQDCGACGVCGDGECTPDESCSECPGDCGFCTPTGWCRLYGAAGTTASCTLRLARESSTSMKPTALQFDLAFDTSRLQFSKLVDSYCTGGACIPWEIPPQATLQPSGHSVAGENLSGVGRRVMIYHASDPAIPLNDAYLSNYYVMGDAILVEVVFQFSTTVPMVSPVTVTLRNIKASDADSSQMGVMQTDDGLIVASSSGLKKCGDGTCNFGETCLTCQLDCGTCPEPCGDGICLGDETCESCSTDCGPCPAVCGDGQCDADQESCSTCPQDCGECPPSCGDGTCNGDETCSTCPGDCGACPPVCGDNECNGTEECFTCPLDCGICPPSCGNGECEPGESCLVCPDDCGTCVEPCGDSVCDFGETCQTCPEDCGICPCGNGICSLSENCASCPIDCGVCPGCPDGTCNGVETCESCPDDCGPCPCGDGLCDPIEEDCASCPLDCGTCPFCGDTICNGDEDCASCPDDCGPCPCGDGVCSNDETCLTCPLDCGQCPFCGDGECNGLEGCESCPEDCGACPPTGWCQIYGEGASTFYCPINVAAAGTGMNPAAGLQFAVNFNGAKVNLVGFHDQLCVAETCSDWDIPPQSTIQPTGHSVVYTDIVNGRKRVLFYHGSAPETPLSTAYRQAGQIVGNPEVIMLTFRLLQTIPTDEPVQVTLDELTATDEFASPLTMVMSDGTLITSQF